jgi:hypothetical protein
VGVAAARFLLMSVPLDHQIYLSSSKPLALASEEQINIKSLQCAVIHGYCEPA